MTAALFKPVKKLKVGSTYTLEINNFRFSWKVGKIDNLKPMWEKDPTAIENDGTRNLSADNFDRVTTSLTDQSSTYFEVKMENVNGSVQNFVAVAKNGKLPLGKGGFRQPKEGITKVHLTPYDFAGNKGETKTMILKPRPKYRFRKS